MRVKDRVENGVSKRVGREAGGGGGGGEKGLLPLAPLSFFGSRSISCLEKNENPVPQSFLAPKTNGNPC